MDRDTNTNPRYSRTIQALRKKVLSGTMHTNELPMWGILLSKYATLEHEELPRNIELTRFVADHELPRIKYSRCDWVTVGCYHWGQYKLLLSEIEFLSVMRRTLGFDILDKIDAVVYAGSAGGMHIPILSAMFPMVEFHCWDPAKFSDIIENYSKKFPDRVKLFKTLFTEQSAREYRKKKTLFISDVRQFVSDPVQMEKLLSKFKDEDHALQRMWVHAMNPLGTMLKFSPPYEAMDYEYLDGVVVTQAYAPQSSTESRLIFVGGDPGMRIYDTLRFEEEYVYINRVLRMRDLDSDDANSNVNKHKIIIRDIINGEVVDSEHTLVLQIHRMRTTTPLVGYDQWRSTQIFLEWALTEASMLMWKTMSESMRAKYRPVALSVANFSVFYRDLVGEIDINHIIDVSNQVIEKYEALIGQTFKTRILKASALKAE